MGIDNVRTIIPDMRGLIASKLDVAYDIQREKGDVNIQKIHGYSDGPWSSSVYINTYTNFFHDENDCTYTIINIPQHDHKTKKETPKYYWIFKCFLLPTLISRTYYIYVKHDRNILVQLKLLIRTPYLWVDRT